MTVFNSENINFIETLTCIFTVKKGHLNILLTKKEDEPYKGYWTLPGNLLSNSETIEENALQAIEEQTGLNRVSIEQSHTFTDPSRNPSARIIAASFIGIIDNKSVELAKENPKKCETMWFPISDVPKTGYDHSLIIENCVKVLCSKISSSEILKVLFPSDFTLPEIQKVYEELFNVKLDRRNFRKKIIALDVLEDTNLKNTGSNGRPAKLYRFKEGINQVNLF